jgi:hypothetical protein
MVLARRRNERVMDQRAGALRVALLGSQVGAQGVVARAEVKCNIDHSQSRPRARLRLAVLHRSRSWRRHARLNPDAHAGQDGLRG